MDALRELNQERRESFRQQIQSDREAHNSQQHPSYAEYPLPALRALLTSVLRQCFENPELNPQIDLIEREKLGGDFVIKIPELLKNGGPKPYIQNAVPKIKQALESSKDLQEVIESIETKGLYVNLSLKDSYYLSSLAPLFSLEQSFGKSDAEHQRRVVIDYSSPNAAKMLHAGHIRTTIIGHVLGNLHEACGAIVFRVNHINDLGGFGFILEGYKRWAESLLAPFEGNKKLLELYAIRRTLEKLAKDSASFSARTDEQRELIRNCFGSVESFDEFSQQFSAYEVASNQAFEKLEDGDPETIEQWKQFIQWSLADFDGFYEAMKLKIDYVIPETYYLHTANELVEEALSSGKAIVFDSSAAAQEKAKVDALLSSEEIEERRHTSLSERIDSDTGAVVIPLSGINRLVIRRSDGRSIYATRDFGAIKERLDLFDATDILYVVGQEQRDHFNQVFEAVRLAGFAPEEQVYLKHIYHGFYVEAGTKKKLSSREGASNVTLLLSESIKYFKEKYDDNSEITPTEQEIIAQQLAVGSLVFNDLKKDMKGSVEIRTGDIRDTIAEFEKSGGAYVVYTACRARAIIRKYDSKLPEISSISDFELNDHEVSLVKFIHRTPEKIAEAARENDPAILLRHLLDFAGAYNSYYAHSPVIKDGEAHEHRLIITAAVQQTLENALRICHIECPERI